MPEVPEFLEPLKCATAAELMMEMRDRVDSLLLVCAIGDDTKVAYSGSVTHAIGLADVAKQELRAAYLECEKGGDSDGAEGGGFDDDENN